MKARKISFVILFLSLITSLNLYAQTGWYAVNTGAAGTLYDFHFLSKDQGAISYWQNKCAITMNGGLNFSQQTIISDNAYQLREIFWIRQHFLLISGVHIYFGWEKGLASTNNGLSWNESIGSVLSADKKGIYSYYGTGKSESNSALGSVFKINDSTNSSSTILNSNKFFKEISFINENTGWIYALQWDHLPPNPHFLYKTTNGGANFITLMQDTAITIYDEFKDLQFFNASNGIVLDSGYFTVTTNGGVSWQKTPNRFNTMHFINKNTGWAAKNDGIYVTATGGLTWAQQSTVTGVMKIQMLDSINGYALTNSSLYKTTTGGLTGIVNNNTEVTTFRLYQNYPNPFNPSTKITFDIPSKQFVSLKVYDISGKEIADLVNEHMNAGSYSVDWNAGAFPSGVYFYNIQAGEFRETKKMLMLK